MKEKTVLVQMNRLVQKIDALESKKQAKEEAKELVAIMGGDLDDADTKALTKEISELKSEIREYYRSLRLLTKLFVFGKYGRYL